MPPKAEIISIGNELLIGKTVNTNASWLALRLTHLGVDVRRILVIGDSVEEISSCLEESLERDLEVIVTTGGLGPTYDDMTLEGVAMAARVPLEENREALQMIRESYKRIGLELTPARIKMSRMPRGANPLRNPVGTAPGCGLRFERTLIVSLPGVPKEMQAIFDESVAPMMAQISKGRVFGEKAFKASGMPESGLAPLLDEVRAHHPSVYFKSHPQRSEGEPTIEFHLTSTGSDPSTVQDALKRAAAELEEILRKKGAKVSKAT